MPRTRSAAAHSSVLAAALELMAERGVEGTSVDAIAERSGVSKATIYKHWADKDALLLEVMASVHGLDKRPVFDTGRTREDLIWVLTYNPQEHARERDRIMPHFVAYSARNPEFGTAWRKMVVAPATAEIRQIICRGVKSGALSPDVDPELSVALLVGPILYSHILLRMGADQRSAFAERVVDAFWRAYGTRVAKRS